MPNTMHNRIAEIMATADEINARMDGTDDGGDQTGNSGGNPPNDDYPADLGEAGKRAIDRMKAERDEAVRKYRELESTKSKPDSTPQNDQSNRNGGQDTQNKTPEKSSDDIRNEVTAQVTADNNARVLRSEVRRLAGNKLTDGSDALRYLDVSDLTPDAHGDYDESAINAKLDQLLQTRPYLAKREVKFAGGADSGSRGTEQGSTPSQLTLDEVRKMDPLDREKARREGRMTNILSGN